MGPPSRNESDLQHPSETVQTGNCPSPRAVGPKAHPDLNFSRKLESEWAKQPIKET